MGTPDVVVTRRLKEKGIAMAELTVADGDDIHARRLRAGLAAGTMVLGSLALMAPFVFSGSPLPYMGTPKDKLRKALAYAAAIHRRRDGSGGAAPRPLTFVDLGSGDGEAVRQAIRAGYDRAVGVELNHTLFGLAQLRRFTAWSARERRAARFHCGDLFRYDLAEADTVLIFGVAPLMESISRKLARECRPGMTVLSYRFALPLRTPGGSGDDLLEADIIYDKEEMRIYQASKTV